MKRASHEDRLRIAGEIRNQLKVKLENNLKALVIFASTAKKQDRAYSDLELLAIVADDYEESISTFMKDEIYCKISYIPYTKALRQAGEISRDWPIAADKWHRMLPIYVKENDECLGHIQTAAWQSLNNDKKFNEAIVKAALRIQKEIGSLINAFEKEIPSDVCTQLFNFSLSVIYLLAFVNRHFYQGLRYAWEESKKLSQMPSDYIRLIEIVHGEKELSMTNRYNAALELWLKIQIWLKSMGVYWEKKNELRLPKKLT